MYTSSGNIYHGGDLLPLVKPTTPWWLLSWSNLWGQLVSITPVPAVHDEARSLLPYGILALVIVVLAGIVLLWRRRSSARPKRHSRAMWILVILILVILGAGIVMVGSFKQPEFKLKSVDVKGVESFDLLLVEVPTAVTFAVVVDIHNPNFIGATVNRLEYELYVNNVYIGKGSLPRSVVIPANGNATIETDVSVYLPSTIQSLITVLQQGGATAKVEGTVHLSVPVVGQISVPFSEEETLI